MQESISSSNKFSSPQANIAYQEIPEKTYNSWQRIVDLMVKIIKVPAGLIMRVHPTQIEVFVKNNSADNPYKKGELAKLNTGLYCEKVMAERGPLHVPNALTDPDWDQNPDIKLGMISYLGYPLIWPDGKIFGTICVLDNKENTYTEVHQNLIKEFSMTINAYLEIVYEGASRETILKELKEANDNLKEIVTQRTNELTELCNDLSRKNKVIESFNQDIRKTETLLRESEERFKALAEYSNDAIIRFDRKHRHLYVNPVVESQFGIKPEYFIGKTPREIGFTKELVALWESSINQVFETGKPHRVEFSIPQGLWFDLLLMPEYSKDNEIVAVITSARDITDRKRIQHALQESEKELREAQRMARLGYWIWDIKTGDVKWSEEIYRIFRQDPKKFTPHIDSIMELSPWPEDHKRNEELISKAIESHEQGEYEQRFLRPDGSTGYYFSTFQGIYNDSGNLISIKGTIQDITDRKQTEEILLRQASFDKIINQILARFAKCSALEVDTYITSTLEEMAHFVNVDSGYVIHINQKNNSYSITHEWLVKGIPDYISNYQDVPFGTHPWTESKIMNGEIVHIKNIADYPPEANLECHDFEREAIKSEILVPLQGRAGHIRGWVGFRSYNYDMNLVKEDYPRIEMVCQAINNVLERKHAEEALQCSEEKYRTFFKNSSDAMLMLQNNVFVDCNKTAVNWLGFSSVEEVRNIHPSEISPEYQSDGKKSRDKAEEMVQYAYEKGAHQFEWEHTRKNGEIFPVDVSLTSIPSTNEKTLHVVWRDISVRKRVEKEKTSLISDLEAKNAEMESFVYTISHDLKTPLVTIGCFLGAIDQDLKAKNTDNLLKNINYISNAAHKMEELLGKVLDLSRIGRFVNPSTQISMNKIIDDALSIINTENDEVEVKIEIQPNMPEITVDRIRIQEVIVNLIENSIKYHIKNKKLKIKIGFKRNNADIIFYVKDNGIGIDPKYHDKIFGLFEQIDPHMDGTGVGLALVKRIIEFHRGKIWVESKGFSQGSTFYFTIPKELKD